MINKQLPTKTKMMKFLEKNGISIAALIVAFMALMVSRSTKMIAGGHSSSRGGDSHGP